MPREYVRWAVVVATMIIGSSANQLLADFTETFSNSPSTEGWIAQLGSQTNPGSDGNPGGYLRSQNALAAYPWVAPADGASGGNFQGDIWTKHGNSLTFSLDIAVGSEGTSFTDFRVFFYKVGQYPNYWKYRWAGVDMDASDGWVHLSVPIDKSWDDDTYLANGWTKTGMPSSFVEVLSNLGPEWDLQAYPGTFTTGGTNIAGLDNVGWTTVEPPPVTGDYNKNGRVDAADYVLWRTAVITQTALDNDPIGLPIDDDQYTQWQENFGNGSSGVGTSAGQSVPEPGCVALLVLGCASIWLLRDGSVFKSRRSIST